MQLGDPQDDGAPLRTHLQRAAASTGRADPLLDVPAVPACATALWTLWTTMSQTRPAGMGPSPITHTEIASACSLYRLDLTPWEVETIIALDGAAMRHALSRDSKKTGAPHANR